MKAMRCGGRRGGWGVAVMVLAGLPATRAGTAEDLDAMLTTGAALARQYLPDELPADLELPSREDWQDFWRLVPEVLENGSLEDLAEWMPYVEAAAQLLAHVDGGEAYLAWLNQRLDYFEVARAVVGATPEPDVPGAAASFQPTPVKGRVTILPPPRQKMPGAPASAVERQRSITAASTRTWKTKLSRRPAPAGSRALVPGLKQVFKEEGVPTQLIWLAEVESSMNPRARNPGGATGLFQFMPATARRFGLRTAAPDERTHPEKSARAAARYLKLLYATFHDWPLALAAYNAGEGRVKTLLSRHKVSTFDGIAPHLPTETQLYVPKVEAMVSLREGTDGLKLPPPSVALAPRLPFERMMEVLAGEKAEAGTDMAERHGDDGRAATLCLWRRPWGMHRSRSGTCERSGIRVQGCAAQAGSVTDSAPGESFRVRPTLASA